MADETEPLVKAALRAIEVSHRARRPPANPACGPLALVVAFVCGVLLGLVIRG